MKNYNYSAPKRAVHRVRRQIAIDVDNAEFIQTLYDCSDKETLVRSIIQLDISQNVTGNHAEFAMELKVRRSGQDFDDAITVGNVNALTPPAESLWLHQTAFPTAHVDAPVGYTSVEVDLKSMRKLTPGDSVCLAVIGSFPSDTGRILGTLTLFFKEK